MSPFIDAALKWRERGFAVFPLEPRGKVPLGSLAPQGFLGRIADPAVIRDWWQRAPKANIGIVTGGGRFVIDLDDSDAVSWFANACGRHGGAPKTLTSARRADFMSSSLAASKCRTARAGLPLAPIFVAMAAMLSPRHRSIPAATSTRSRATCRSRKRRGGSSTLQCRTDSGAAPRCRHGGPKTPSCGPFPAFCAWWQTPGRASATGSRTGPHAASPRWCATG